MKFRLYLQYGQTINAVIVLSGTTCAPSTFTSTIEIIGRKNSYDILCMPINVVHSDGG